MIPSVSETLQQYRLLAERIDGLLFSGWEESQVAKLEQFARVIEREASVLGQLNAAASNFVIWQATEDRIQETLAQIGELTISGSDNDGQNAWNRWRQEFEQTLTEVPEAEEVIILPSAWKPGDGDGLLAWLWKRQSRNRAVMRRLAYSVRNSVRRWFGKAELEQKPQHRVLALRDFVSFYDEARQEFLRRMLFEQLNEFASGNITVAMLFWLRAIREISKQKVVLSPAIDFDHSFLQRLPEGELFTLGALLHHETLTAEQHALVFRQSPADSYMMFEQLRNKGIVLATPNGYLINQLLYRPLVRLLTAKNILH